MLIRFAVGVIVAGSLWAAADASLSRVELERTLQEEIWQLRGSEANLLAVIERQRNTARSLDQLQLQLAATRDELRQAAGVRDGTRDEAESLQEKYVDRLNALRGLEQAVLAKQAELTEVERRIEQGQDQQFALKSRIVGKQEELRGVIEARDQVAAEVAELQSRERQVRDALVAVERTTGAMHQALVELEQRFVQGLQEFPKQVAQMSPPADVAREEQITRTGNTSAWSNSLVSHGSGAAAYKQTAEIANDAKARVFIHYSAKDEQTHRGAERLASYLEEQGYEFAKLRPVGFSIRSNTIRYFHEDDRRSGSKLVARLRESGGVSGLAVQDFSSYPRPPRRGNLEVWLASAQ